MLTVIRGPGAQLGLQMKNTTGSLSIRRGLTYGRVVATRVAVDTPSSTVARLDEVKQAPLSSTPPEKACPPTGYG
jgi:hypothetical protein